jgi:hypothetical protein
MDGRQKNGGIREGAGRPKKADEERQGGNETG